jgi:hypothetical protein
MVLMTAVIVEVNERVLSSVKASQLKDFMWKIYNWWCILRNLLLYFSTTVKQAVLNCLFQLAGTVN